MQQPAQVHHQAPTQVPTQPTPSREDAFWARMGALMKNDRDEHKCLLNEGLHRAETSLKNDIQHEAKTREKMGKHINARIHSMMDRAAKLELTPQTPSPSAAMPPSDSWSANHLIFGGWDDSVPNDQRCKEIELLQMQLPESTHSQHLRPFAPRRGGPSIVKVRWSTPTHATSAQFMASHKLQQLCASTTLWVAVERRRMLRISAETLGGFDAPHTPVPHYNGGTGTIGNVIVLHEPNGRLCKTPG